MYEHYHAIIAAAELPENLLSEQETELLAQLITDEIVHHPALSLSRAVAPLAKGQLCPQSGRSNCMQRMASLSPKRSVLALSP